MSVYSSSPINKLAALVTSQTNCDSIYRECSRKELTNIKQYLQRKLNKLKYILKIERRSQHKNLMARYNKYKRGTRGHKQPRALQEYVKLGTQIQVIMRRCQELRIKEETKLTPKQIRLLNQPNRMKQK